MKCGDCQVKQGLSRREIVLWDDKSKTIQVNNLQKSSVYLLITNLIDAAITDSKPDQTLCLECDQKVPSLIFHINIESGSPQYELSFFKYCILVLDSLSGAYKKTLGTNERQLYLKGNLVAKHLTMQSQKKIKETFFHQRNICEQKKVSKNHNFKLQFPASQINESGISRDIGAVYEGDIKSQEECFSLRENQVTSQINIVDDGPSQLTSFVKKTWTEQAKVQRQDKKEQKEEVAKQMKEYTIFVIKMQKEIENLYRTQMLHEYVWQEEETVFVMQQVTLFFGEYQSMQQKRRYMRFTFKREANDLEFQGKWDTLSREILLRKNKIVQGKIINYYIFSKQNILPNKFLTNKLFLLPYTSPIIDLCLADPWVAIAATNYVLFIHAYQPMDYFQHEGKVAPLKLCVHKKNSSLLLILHREGISCYKLFDKMVALHSVCFTSFLEPHTIGFMGDSLMLAGVDYYQKDFKRTISAKRMVYRIQDKFKNYSQHQLSTSTKAQLQHQYEIMNIQSQKKQTPITNVVVPNKDVFACTFMHKFLLFSKHGQKLVEVELKSNITKSIFLPFIFNLFNFFVVTQNNQAVRIGVESYGGALGAQLQKMKLAKVWDCNLSLRENAKYELMVASGDGILQSNYLKDENVEIIRQQKGKIIFLSCDRIGVVYLIDLEHSFELKYLQI